MDPELNSELLEVYRYKRSMEDIIQMRRLLDGSKTAVPELWEEVAGYLEGIEAK